MTLTLTVAGMTCENCARHVREALGNIPGVRSVQVDLAENRAIVDAQSEIPRSTLSAALDQAGYSLE